MRRDKTELDPGEKAQRQLGRRPDPILLTQFELFRLDDRDPVGNPKYARWTRALPLYDSIPKYFYGEDAKARMRDVKTKNCTFFVPGYPVPFTATLTPATIQDETGSYSKWPGAREELVHRTLRYLIVHGHTSLDLSSNTLITPQAAIMELLSDWGHGLTSSELEGALDILAGSTIAVHSTPCLPITLKGRSTLLARVEKYKRTEDGYIVYKITLSPNEIDAIKGGLFSALNFEAIMKLKTPLARRLYEILLIHHRGAEKPSKNPNARGYPIRLKTLIDEGTIAACSRLGKTAVRFKTALNELHSKGHLDPARPYTMRPIKATQKTGGRRRVIDYEFIPVLSDSAVEDMIQSHGEAQPIPILSTTKQADIGRRYREKLK